jgi:hypothetical protein
MTRQIDSKEPLRGRNISLEISLIQRDLPDRQRFTAS